MSAQKMDRAAAERFVAAWCASWRRVDIDTVVAHFADDAQMRSPLALTLTGSPTVTAPRTSAPTGGKPTATSKAPT
ncbi:hypothetical protein Q2941_18755 [Bradyrhizobium sp. UFLA05-153]